MRKHSFDGCQLWLVVVPAHNLLIKNLSYVFPDSWLKEMIYVFLILVILLCRLCWEVPFYFLYSVLCPLPLQNILASACANEAENARYVRVEGDVHGNTGALPTATSSPASSSHAPQNSTANTRSSDRPTGEQCTWVFHLVIKLIYSIVKCRLQAASHMARAYPGFWLLSGNRTEEVERRRGVWRNLKTYLWYRCTVNII